VQFAQSHEINFLKDMAAQVKEQTKNEPYPDVLGPTRDRTGQNGIVIRHGYIIAEWGDTERVDMTFSVAKSYVATTAGLALDRGMIRNINDRVADYVEDGGFDSPHNAKITWHMLLNQTSEWEGTLFEKPDVADRREGRDRSLREPGTFWEYNDVRVNRAALAILRVWGQPLPEVLKREIMDPIGASPTWEWHGYRTSWVDLNGRRVQSVSGGGHWGGGVWASTRDHARFGLLHLRRGKWNGKQLLSEKWIDMATTPTDIRPVYGYMWWLNNEKGTTHAGATPKSFFARGAGGNTIWICPELDIVVVTRWLDTGATNDFMKLVQAAVKS
jgi:CubicO group peptidase (beta-lactamase class C family)